MLLATRSHTKCSDLMTLISIEYLLLGMWYSLILQNALS
jgi:hypothetical protein